MPPSEIVALCFLLLSTALLIGGFFLLKKVVGRAFAWTFLAFAVGGFTFFVVYAETLGGSVEPNDPPRYVPAHYQAPSYSCVPGEGSCKRT